MFKEGNILCSKYKLKKRFDEGGYSSVWLAEDLETQENLALKIYESIEDMEAFKKGYKLVYKLTHSNIFTPLAYYVHNGVPFLVMSYCPNGSAKSRIGKMSEDEIWNFAHDVAGGLEYLHDKKAIVHQDIKPGNILIDDDGKYMITDFDISTKTKETQRMTARQVEEMQDFNYGCGTPDYMAPERWPDKEVNYRPPLRPAQASDIWSLGATLYELMEGHVPFGETGGACQRNLCKNLSPRNRKRNAVPKIAGNFSKELRKLVYMCLAKDAWDRPSAKQIAECASHHKAPVLHPTPIPKWVIFATTCSFLVSCIIIYLLVLIGNKKDIENSYFSTINEAVMIVKQQSSVPQQYKNITAFNNYGYSYIGKLLRAKHLYEDAQNISVSEKVKNQGKKLWASAQSTIDKEFLYYAEKTAKTITTESLASNKYENYAKNYVEKIIQAKKLYQAAKIIPVSDDSVIVKGDKIWAEVQPIIDNEYSYFTDRMIHYDKIGADEASSGFFYRCMDLEEYASDSVKTKLNSYYEQLLEEKNNLGTKTNID